MACDQSENEPAEDHRSEGKERVAKHAHPAQPGQHRSVEEFSRSRIPRSNLDRRPGLGEADGKHAEQHHGCEPDVDRPERDRQRTIFPHQPRTQSAQAEEHEPQTEHAVYAEERSVAVNGSQVQSLHVIKSDGRIDHEAEQARADKVPESDRDEKIDRPLVGANPGLSAVAASQANVLPCLESDEDERHDFESAEDRTQRQHRIRSSSEVQVVESADDPTRKINDS